MEKYHGNHRGPSTQSCGGYEKKPTKEPCIYETKPIKETYKREVHILKQNCIFRRPPHDNYVKGYEKISTKEFTKETYIYMESDLCIYEKRPAFVGIYRMYECI